VACLLALFCITAPYARLPLQPVSGFVILYSTVIAICDLIAATLIVAQFWVVRWTWLLVLASGYFFTALMVVPGALTFPGVVTQAGLLGAGLQTAPWIGASWQLGSPIFLIAAVLIRDSRQTVGICQRSPGLAIALSIVLVTAIACGLTWTIIVHPEILPPIFVNEVRLHQNIVLVVAPMMVLEAIAFLLLWRGGRSVLDLWLMVMCCAWLFELSLGGFLAGSRYSLGWYIARAFQMAATLIILLLFLSETTALYANMVMASIQRRGARHTRQVAMDTMAASIGHEIKQPLSAVLINASVCELLLSKAEPNLKEAIAAAKDIAADARRINQVIGSVRTMFRSSTHDRQPLNLNTVIRDVLSTVELELRLQRVTLKTDLDDDLPPVLGNSGQLHQLFLNFIANALEAMSTVAGRSSVLTVRSRIVAGASDIAVTVEDTGIGIADKDSARIFEPFFSTKAAGTGVGLAICRVISEAHGGRLEVQANKPNGTIFRVILPVGGEE
jgi:signal transduction histidine kinase